ncbi:GntT/GntP/DsdX family permease [Shigella flexneri]
MKARMHAFLALMVVSMGAGLFSGMPLDKIAATMEKGWEAPWLPGGGCRPGSYVGKILYETGAVDQIAVKMLKLLRSQPRALCHRPCGAGLCATAVL